MAFFLFLALVQGFSLLLCGVTVKRLYAYIRRYKFDESVYTLLFGFLHLRYFIFAYVFMTFLATASGLFLAFLILES